MANDARDVPRDGAVAVLRRAPFSDNPRVGARGLRTQQRILDAALRAFGEVGYHACSIDRITTAAQISRVSFYQYFADKEDVFRHLAGQVARQVGASTEALDPLTPDLDGWTAMRTWVGRYTEIHARYEPVFHAYEIDPALANLARATGDETVVRLRTRLAMTTLPSRQLDPVIRLALECLNHTLGVRAILGSVVPDAYPRERLETALADVVHRTMFGLRQDVNVHATGGPRPPRLDFGPEALELFRQGADEDSEASGNPALGAILASARDVFVARGYHATRVDDLVVTAGVSHGAFYRYFPNKEALARLLTARAVQAAGAMVMGIPDVAELAGPTGKSALRRWLRRYNVSQAHEAAMMRVWLDAALQDPAIKAESAPPLDWGRRRMSRYLRPRGFGDTDMDAVIMVGLFGVFGARQRPATDVDAAAHIIERGLLGG